MTDHETAVVRVRDQRGYDIGYTATCATWIDRDVSGLIMSSERSPQFRFAQRFDYDEHGCWNWTGTLRGPYGVFSWRELGRAVAAHRAALMLIGVEVPADMDVDHLCRNKICVNPCHLEVVTHWENTRRGNSPHAQHARKTHCVNGHEFTPENTVTTEGHRRCRTCRNATARARKRAKRAERSGDLRERPTQSLIDIERHLAETRETE